LRTKILSKSRTRAWAPLLGLLLLTPISSVSAEPRRWGALTPGDYLWVGGFFTGAYVANQSDLTNHGNWQGGILLDDPVRNALKANTLEGREQASKISDFTMGSLLAVPLVLNAGLLSGLKYSDLTGAGRIVMISLQSYAFSAFLQQITISIKRSRPGQLECSQNNPGYYPDCGTKDAFNSFYSGHTAMAFTAAGLVCRHNESLNLISDPLTRGLICGGSLAAAGTVGLLRLVSDRHYFSDVWVGGLIGFFSGYALPALLHQPENENKIGVALVPTGPTTTSVQVSYSF